MIVKLHDVAGGEQLSGATNGLRAMTLIAQSLPLNLDGSLLILDFSGIEIATGSFLRSLIFSLRDFCLEHRRGVALVLANLNEAVQEELTDRLRSMREAIVTCKLSPTGDVTSARVVGILEERQAETLAAVMRAGETDAPTLAGNDHESDASANKWNNRLAALVAKGILKERRSGRVKRYSAVLEGLEHGS